MKRNRNFLFFNRKLSSFISSASLYVSSRSRFLCVVQLLSVFFIIFPLVGNANESAAFELPAAADTNQAETTPFERSSSNSSSFSDWAKTISKEQKFWDHKKNHGKSLLVSGALILVGSHIGMNLSSDGMSRVVYGLTEGFGAFIAAQGAKEFLVEPESINYINALNGSPRLSPEEKYRLWNQLQQSREEREKWENRINMSAHFVLAGINAYSSSNEPDSNARTLFQVMALANLCLGMSYAF